MKLKEGCNLTITERCLTLSRLLINILKIMREESLIINSTFFPTSKRLLISYLFHTIEI
jgi:hypothetical protein